MKQISVANGNYIGQDGTQKTKWVKVGVIGTSQNGKEYVLLDPTINLAGFKREEGKDMIMCTVYDGSQQQSNNTQTNQAPQQGQQQGYNPQQQGQQQQQAYQAPQPTYQDAQGNSQTQQQSQQAYQQNQQQGYA